MSKILVVDDEADIEILIKQKFRKQIGDGKYSFLFAFNGNDALQKLSENEDVDVVLTDINMPGMDGLTLLSRLNEVNPLLKTVIVSAYGDMENIREAMNNGAFDFLCKPVDFEDLEITIEKTLKQVAQLRQTLMAVKENDLLSMYVNEALLKYIRSKQHDSNLLANETIEASILFIDICGFTTITEKHPANTVVHMLNHYFDVMVKEILSQKGSVDKFIGDAVLAVFQGYEHLDRAVKAALALRKAIDALPQDFHDLRFLPKISIGLNSGEMIAGNIGSASLKRLDWTVIGDVVNTAQRLRSVAKPGQILLTEALYHKIKDTFNCTRVGEVQLKNKQAKVVVYEVSG